MTLAHRLMPLTLPAGMARTLAHRLQKRFDALRQMQLAWRLARSPRHIRGVARLDGWRVAYTDARSLYMEYKDIFIRRIYHFEADNPHPRILDGGGCIGLATLYFKSIYPLARVTCLEPDPEIGAILHENLDRNHLDDVQVVAAGLAAQAGTIEFLPDGSDGGRLQTTTGLAPRPNVLRVPTLPLSPFLDQPLDFLKLNIEGQELDVLREAAQADRLRQVKQMVIEYHGWPEAPQRLGAILELLDQQGFTYLVHDFDDQTCPTSKPPFALRGKPWFCLVYARRRELP